MEETTNSKQAQIYPAIARVMAAVKAITKSQRNQAQGFNFRGIDDVMNELHTLFAREGVFILPECLDYDVKEVKAMQYNNQGQPMKERVTLYTRVKVAFHFTAPDGSEVVTINYGEGMDNGDKGMNKAMSIALKYALLQMLLIPTNEQKDPDAESYEIKSSWADPMQDILKQISTAATKESLVAIWNNNQPYHADVRFSTAMSERKKAILK
jgi:hypothetical protein